MTSTPVKRKKDESTTTLQLPSKVIKVEKDDNEWSTSVVPQEPNCLPQPQTSFSAPTMAASREGCLLNIVPDSSDEMHDSGKQCSCKHQVDSGGQFAASPESSQEDITSQCIFLFRWLLPIHLPDWPWHLSSADDADRGSVGPCAHCRSDSPVFQRRYVFSLWADSDLLNLGSDEEDSVDEELLVS